MKHTKHTFAGRAVAAFVCILACSMPIYTNAASISRAAEQTQVNTFYEQLCAFNYNWQQYKNLVSSGKACRFYTDAEFVQAHLSNVIPILRTSSVAHLTREQYQSRTHLIDLLDGYCSAGKFPLNYHRAERVPVFIDEHNTYCAVGYLLKQTGHDAVAKRIAAADNYVWVKDINDEGLLAWQQASGLSLDELKLIQGAYDNYEPFARFVVNRFEIPQKPEQVTLYFEDEKGVTSKGKKHIWLHGEGKNSVLNGRWEQNFSEGIPWIEGYYHNGKRSGQWKEYYKGTDKLCRTENWRNDKLNGVRKRFSRQGKLVEEILFKDGVAVKKTNYELADSLTYIRNPIGENLVYTEVYTMGGMLLAAGNESIYNPSGLQWFQNIELTALNTVAAVHTPGYRAGTHSMVRGVGGDISFENTPQLVQYKKEGEWVYYKESFNQNAAAKVESMLRNDYRHFGKALYASIHQCEGLKMNSGYDSIKVVYAKDALVKFFGYGADDLVHLEIRYHEPETIQVKLSAENLPLMNLVQTFTGLYTGFEIAEAPAPVIKELGQYDSSDRKIGIWKHYNENGILCKTENFIIPFKEKEEGVSKL